MILNKIELKKIIYDFNSVSNRLLNSSYEDYKGNVSKFIGFINSTDIIASYIEDCGECDWNMEEAFDYNKLYRESGFKIIGSDKEEVRNVYAILRFIADNKVDIVNTIAGTYCVPSNSLQEGIDDFNHRVATILVDHIEAYLTKIGIDMGFEETVKYKIEVNGGHVIVATDSSTVNATYNENIDFDKLSSLFNEVRKQAADLSNQDKEKLENSLNIISDELKDEKPKRNVVGLAISTLRGIKGTVEFMSAVTALAAFAMSIFN